MHHLCLLLSIFFSSFDVLFTVHYIACTRNPHSFLLGIYITIINPTGSGSVHRYNCIALVTISIFFWVKFQFWPFFLIEVALWKVLQILSLDQWPNRPREKMGVASFSGDGVASMRKPWSRWWQGQHHDTKVHPVEVQLRMLHLKSGSACLLQWCWWWLPNVRYWACVLRA